MIREVSGDEYASGEDAAEADVAWWRRAVVYQVYIRSFADGNGDGTGDLAGLRSRLDHLADLGIDAIWVNPWYPSPLADGGYDVADYRDIHPDFGTLDEADAFITEVHARGLRVLVDLVPNHTSVEHRWFQDALAGDDAARDRYLFSEGRGPDGSLPPTNWTSVFGGPAWERVNGGPNDGLWYLHIFDVSQPDLNWRNREVRDEFDNILRFWLDRGVDGFRVDVAHGMVKDWTFPDVDPGIDLQRAQDLPDGSHPHWDRDELHDLVRRWRRVVDQYDDRMIVAEATVNAKRLPLYLRPGEYHQSFNFDLIRARWSAKDFEQIITDAASAAADIGAASTWVLSNHDIVRHTTRYGLPVGVDYRTWLLDGPHDLLDPEAGARRGRAAALITLALPGSAYIYQGDELGLPEVWNLPIEILEDPNWERSGHTDKGRDGCRVPLPWTVDGPSFGFGSNGSWLPQPAHFGPLSVEAQDGDAESTLNLYRRALALRTELFRADEELTMLDWGDGVLAFRRGTGATVITNMGDRPVALPPGDVVLASGPLTDETLSPETTSTNASAEAPPAETTSAGTLPPDAAVWLRPSP